MSSPLQTWASQMGEIHLQADSGCAVSLRVPAHRELGLALVAAGSKKSSPGPYVLILCRLQDEQSALLTAECLAHFLKAKTTRPGSTLRLPGEEEYRGIRLADIDGDFVADRYVVADPTEFGLKVPAGLEIRLLIASDDSTEGELRGQELLDSVRERTPLGLSPPGIAQPRVSQPARGPSPVLIRRKRP